MFARPFAPDRGAASRHAQPFRERVASAALPRFDQGIAALTRGDYEKAEQTLKGAVKLDADSTPMLTYLAAVFAAAGHDAEAASAWQTALDRRFGHGGDLWWLGDALLRSADLAQARTILEEAVSEVARRCRASPSRWL